MNSEMNNSEKRVPLLLTSHGKQYEKQSFYSLSEDRYQTTCLPILSNTTILGSAYGWLVLRECLEDDFFLWNPASMDIIDLPRLDDPHLHNICALSKPPTEPDCIVVFNHSFTMRPSACRIGDDEFVKVTSNSEEEDCGIIAVASFRGEIYGIIDHAYEFVTIHLVGGTVEIRSLLIDGEQPWEIPHQSIRPSWVTWHDDYLIESQRDGELLFVTKMYSGAYLNDGVEFRVFRVDVDGMECVELDSIDGLTIFVNYYGNTFCRSSLVAGTKPNCIYYTNQRGRDIHVFDFDDRSTTVLLPCPTVGRYVSTNYWVDLPDILGSDCLPKIINIL